DGIRDRNVTGVQTCALPIYQGLLDDAVLDVQAQIAGALLRSAPAHAVGVAADVLNFVRLDPFALFRDGRRAVLGAFGDGAHGFDLCRIRHNFLSFAFSGCARANGRVPTA